jgi:hypothetical protein
LRYPVHCFPSLKHQDFFYQQSLLQQSSKKDTKVFTRCRACLSTGSSCALKSVQSV